MNVASIERPALHVHQQGTHGPAVVFLHYYGGSSRTWAPLIARLPAGTRVIAPDLRGWGRSDKSADSYTLASYADDIQAMLTTLGVDDYVLVGHSMGGKIAQLIASRRPAGLRGLVLVAPAPPTAMALPVEALKAMSTVYDTRESIEGALAHMLVSRPLPKELHDQVIEDSLGGAPAAKVAWPMMISQQDITTDVGAINVPTLVISGSEDKVDTVDTLKAELIPRIPGAKLSLIEGIGHLVPLQAPDAVATLLGSFLQALMRP